MKTIGLIGGMSWESTQSYYRIVNTIVKERLGGLHSAQCVLCSVDFGEIEAMQTRGDWDAIARALAEAAQALERAGAEIGVLCTNTMHNVFDAIQAAVAFPFLHIADATAKAVSRSGMNRIGLLGTAFTMEQDFYKERLRQAGMDVIIPDAEQRREVSRIIYEELCLGVIAEPSRRFYNETVESLAGFGARGVIMGCTEIGLLLRPEDVSVPLFDTAALHATEVALIALGESR